MAPTSISSNLLGRIPEILVDCFPLGLSIIIEPFHRIQVDNDVHYSIVLQSTFKAPTPNPDNSSKEENTKTITPSQQYSKHLTVVQSAILASFRMGWPGREFRQLNGAFQC